MAIDLAWAAMRCNSCRTVYFGLRVSQLEVWNWIIGGRAAETLKNKTKMKKNTHSMTVSQ